MNFCIERRSGLHFSSSRLILVLIAWILQISLPLSAGIGEEEAALWGHTLSSDSHPLVGVKLRLTRIGESREFMSLFSKQRGIFMLVGIPPGIYDLEVEYPGFQSREIKRLYLDPAETLYVRVHMQIEGGGSSLPHERIRLDHTQNLHQTVLDSDWIRAFPLAHNIWSLVENLDLSATTDRIDVGELYNGLPALFSARGGTSWTQTVYALNDLEVTDPYHTGRPLLYPDFYSVNHSHLMNAGMPPQVISPGGYLNLTTPEGGDDLQGGAAFFFLNHSLQSSNISSNLRQEGLTESNRFHFMTDGNVWASGPLLSNKLYFYSSLSAFDLSRDPAEFPEYADTGLLSGTLGLCYRLASGRLRVLWTGQKLAHSAYGAARQVRFSATSSRRERFSVGQLLWDTHINPQHHIKLGLGLAQADIRSDFQENVSGPHSREIFAETRWGASPQAGEDLRRSFTAMFQGDLYGNGFLGARHRLRYGVKWQHNSSSSQREIWENLHLRFWEGRGREVVLFNGPFSHDEAGRNLSIFAQDSISFSDFVTVIFGFHLISSRAWMTNDNPAGSERRASDPAPAEKSEINWFNLAPRLGIVIPLTPRKGAALKLSYSRYYYALPLNYLTYGNPEAVGGQVVNWQDLNQDGDFQSDEAGDLIRREGPFFSSIDPEIKRPYTDEYVIAFTTGFKQSWSLTLSGFARNTKNLVHTLNVGVPFSAFTPEYHLDWGDDRVPYTYDDLVFTVFNQDPDTLGQDHYLLTNVEPDSRNTLYYGADFSLIKRFGRNLTFFLSLTATQADGSTNPGNTAHENDDGIVGRLFNDPNSLINAKGRVRFDRAYTGRLGVNVIAPWGIHISGIIKYYDGQPFARKIIIPGFNQGPFYIQANPRGVSRYEYNRTIDIRIEKKLSLGSSSRLRLILDGFNILNRGLATRENAWTRPEYPERYATEIQSPRIFRLGLVWEF